MKYSNPEGRYIFPKRYTNKDVLRKEYNFSRTELEKAIESGTFEFDGLEVQLQVAKVGIMYSFNEELKSIMNLLNAQKNHLQQSNDFEKELVLRQSIDKTLLLIKTIEQRIEEDNAYNEKVNHLKGRSSIDLWNKKADELRKNYELFSEL